MNQSKLLTVLAGMAVLAGLAYHQAGVGPASTEDESILIGTAIDTTADAEASEGNTPVADSADAENCLTDVLAQVTPDADDCDSSLVEEIPQHDALRGRNG